MDRVRVHFGDCRFCNHGAGVQRNVEQGRSGHWLGPFDDLFSAWTAAENTGRSDIQGCNVCCPESGRNRSVLYGTVIKGCGSDASKEWIVIHDESMPVALSMAATFRNVGEYEYYDVDITMVAETDIAAYDVRFAGFDIWEKHLWTGQATEIIDLAQGETYSARISGEMSFSAYSGYSEDAATCIIVYVEQARSKDGQIIKADINSVISAAGECSTQFDGSTARIDRRRKVYRIGVEALSTVEQRELQDELQRLRLEEWRIAEESAAIKKQQDELQEELQEELQQFRNREYRLKERAETSEAKWWATKWIFIIIGVTFALLLLFG